jgi:hypothetical protein
MPGYNHYPSCTCGWCVKDGGGPTVIAATPAMSWRRTASSCDSYIDPNAECPVCGAEVFFYQSPFGGRVFFDHLGPPWPKHPCTDTHQARLGALCILAPPSKVLGTQSRRPLSIGWIPLVPLRSASIADKEKVRLDQNATHLASHYLYRPNDFADGRPCYWRRSASDPASVEVSTFKLNEQGLAKEHRIQIPHWIRNDEHLASLGEDAVQDGPALNAIGWSMSFVWRTSQPDWLEASGVDIAAAKTYFLAAAEKGFWAAWNNLGVIARDGLGGTPDPVMAFHYFERTAEFRQPISIRHLADCHRRGVGVAVDESQAAFLEELANSLEPEKQPSP